MSHAYRDAVPEIRRQNRTRLPSSGRKSFRSGCNVGVIGQVDETSVHGHTYTHVYTHIHTQRDPQETGLLVHSGSALWRRQAKAGSSRARAAAPARSFV